MSAGGRHGNGAKRKNKHPSQRLACSLDTEGIFNMDEMEDEIMQPGYPSEEDINAEGGTWMTTSSFCALDQGCTKWGGTNFGLCLFSRIMELYGPWLNLYRGKI